MKTATTALDLTSNVFDRNDTIKEIRRALKARSGKTWSVTGGRGTSWGWITITAPPKRRDRYDSMTPEDAAELTALLGLDFTSRQSVLVPASTDFRREYVQRACGLPVTQPATPYWD